MFDSFKAMGALAGLMKNQDKLKSAMQRIQRDLAGMRLVGEAGAGAVRAVVSGDLRVISVEIAPGLGAGPGPDAERRQAEALIAEAVNDGLRKARAAAAGAMQAQARELGLPDLPPGLSGLLG